jgi:hypothetical protein
LLVGKLVLVGVPHNQHKMRITQATSNLLEYHLALHQKKLKNPYNHHDQSQRRSPSASRCNLSSNALRCSPKLIKKIK